MMAVLGLAGGAYEEGALNRGDVLGLTGKELTGAQLPKFPGRLLACTTLVGGGEGKSGRIGSLEKLNRAFTGRQRFVFPAVKLALEVSFKDFLDGLVLIGAKIPTLSP